MTTLLCIGDIHLGRLPVRLGASGLDPHALSPAVAWREAVTEALAIGASAVVLAGDVVDDDRDRFEAYGHLERGVRRLVEAGVAVVGVAGNHDGLVLPRLAARIPAFTLLGAGGRWERLALPTEPAVDLIGWSFPASHHRGDPLAAPGLAECLAARRTGAALIGVLHADLDATGSPYAPVRRAALAAVGADAWVVGHVHAPDDLDAGGRPLGYLGSLVGLDRGETGPRGPWRLDVRGAGRLTAEHAPVGPLRWERVAVDVGGLPDDAGAEDALHEAVEASLRRRQATDPTLEDLRVRAVGVTVELTGRTATRARLREATTRWDPRDLTFELGGRRWAVVAFEDRTRATVDLATLATQRTPVGALARLIAGLEAGERLDADLAGRVQRDLGRFSAERWRVGTPLDETALLRDAAWTLLDGLLAQRGDGR